MKKTTLSKGFVKLDGEIIGRYEQGCCTCKWYAEFKLGGYTFVRSASTLNDLRILVKIAAESEILA